MGAAIVIGPVDGTLDCLYWDELCMSVGLTRATDPAVLESFPIISRISFPIHTQKCLCTTKCSAAAVFSRFIS